ncbi:manganese efflux pump MntP [Desmospora profundinema]|uniref:Mn2+ efflux pump MntP n=1 Tax=Desmospora profundinema TaxID=1571184 RepID=A0ABU1IMZ5_9BACL|nr:manganese efflux pump [Desmospora profundinema]MDR6225160.1 putative Mn2+ efflux pump MntP [Desmospora profundinema]
MEVAFILTFMLIVFAAHVDTLGVGVAYGLRKRSIPRPAIWVIGVVGGAVAGLAVAGGTWIQQWLPLYISDWVAGGILIAIGAYSWMTSRVRATRIYIQLDREWWFLAFGLSVNNLAMGLTGGLLGYHPVVFGVCIGLMSNLMLWLGAFLGKHIGLMVGHPWVFQAGGLLLILIGVFQIF